MKKFVLFFGLLIMATMINAQAPQGFKYQTVARNNTGEILASQSISFRMTILQGALPGTVVYAETHSATTSASGLATLEIGRGTPVTGSFAAINWSTTPIFLKTEIDPAGGSAYIEMGTSELLSVPYAFYAKTAGNGFSGNYNDLTNKPALWDSTWLTIKNKPTTVAGYGITDAMTTAHAANGISTGNIADWNAAFGWGNHAAAGYLTNFTETDPIFSVHPASGINSGNIANWNTAFGWGNHAAAGYLTSFTETDPIFSVHPAKGITAGNISNWNTAFGWGNHATAGYLTSFTETDPIFGVHPANGITSGNISNWNTAFGWGNHATAGYLTSFTEIDPIWTTASGNYYTKINMQTNGAAALHFNNLTNKPTTVAGYGITNAMTTAHPANGITASNITNWNTAFTNRITSATGTAPLTLTISSNLLTGSIAEANSTTNGYLTFADWNSFNNKVSSQWVTNGLKLYYNSGNIGIGTTNPQNKIDIAGNAVIGSTYSGTNAAPANGLLVEGRVGFGTSTPAASAAFEVASTNSGVLLPRMTHDQRFAIANPAEGLMVFCTNCGSNGALSIYSNGTWRTFIPCSCAPPTAGVNTLSPGQINWNWNPVAGAVGYKWNTTTNYGSATEMGTFTTKTETGNFCGSTVVRYVWAYNECEISVPVTLSQVVSTNVPESPASGTHTTTQTSIVWNWNTVGDATGYKFNTTDDFGTATEMGTATTIIETGLTCGTAYTRYVWAYNGCGFSTPATFTQTTLPCWNCGDPFTVNHVATGGVAPVDKTVTYGTVTNIPGATTKCWITRNLGASQQATAVNDATEASAGWNWQFNRKQGYKHDGATRTPNTTWVSSISETSDWTPANDPCTLELGAGWRIPTNAEWTNVDASGNWTTWTGPWNSGLKMHAAGYLHVNDGSLINRGSIGYCWSSKQFNPTDGSGLYFDSGLSNLDNSSKAYGLSLRCLKD